MSKLYRRFIKKLYLYSFKKYREAYKIKHPTESGKITDHAVLRYIERVEGRDIEKLKEELLNPKFIETSYKYGGTGKFIVNGVLYTVIKGRVISLAKPNPNQATISGLNSASDTPRRWEF